MGKISLNVPEELGPFLDEQAAHHGFKDRDAFVAELVAREADRTKLRTLLEAGRDCPDMEGEVEALFLRLRGLAAGSSASSLN